MTGASFRRHNGIALLNATSNGTNATISITITLTRKLFAVTLRAINLRAARPKATSMCSARFLDDLENPKV
jgi:hypothetical protein